MESPPLNTPIAIFLLLQSFCLRGCCVGGKESCCFLGEWKDACRSMADVPATPFKFKTLGRSFSVKKNESLARAAGERCLCSSLLQ